MTKIKTVIFSLKRKKPWHHFIGQGTSNLETTSTEFVFSWSSTAGPTLNSSLLPFGES